MQNLYNLPQTVSVPGPLFGSEQGRYFVGCAEGLDLTGSGAWASLYNPAGSKVNLYVSVWTAASLFDKFSAHVWFNASMPGEPSESAMVSTSNYALRPLPRPKVKLLFASAFEGSPSGGVKAFIRTGDAGSTIVAAEEGKFIFPPGGSFSIFLTAQGQQDKEEGQIAFGWWEETAVERNRDGKGMRRAAFPIKNI